MFVLVKDDGEWKIATYHNVDVKGDTSAGTAMNIGISCYAYRLRSRLRLVQGDAGAHPGLFDVEIDAHHFALTHSHKVVDQRWIAVVVRPNKHHTNFGLRFLAIDRHHKWRVIDFPL